MSEGLRSSGHNAPDRPNKPNRRAHSLPQPTKLVGARHRCSESAPPLRCAGHSGVAGASDTPTAENSDMPHYRRWRKTFSQTLDAMRRATRHPVVYSKKLKRQVSFDEASVVDPRASNWFTQKMKNAEQARWDEKQSKLLYYESTRLGEGEWPNKFKPRDSWLAWKRKHEGVPVN